MMTNKQIRSTMIARAIEGVKSFGGTGGGAGVEDKLTLQTKHGVLSIWFDPDDIPALEKKHGPTITAFCAFEDPAALKAFGLDGNNFSGKWNWHCLDESGVEALLVRLRHLVEE